jgi:hypothetical protein
MHETQGAKPPSSYPGQRPAEEVAQKILGELPLPQRAVEVGSVPWPSLSRPPWSTGCWPLVDVHRFWYVPGAPRAVIAWIQARAPRGNSSGETLGVDPVINGTSYFGPSDGVQNATLLFEATVVNEERTALRADAEVIPAGARCAPHRGEPPTR